MKIELKELTIKEVADGYIDNSASEEGVFAYNGKLDIRPKYQRNFIYKPHQAKAVIDTVIKGFPLNVMYWVKKSDGNFEILDGQQRTMSICEYIEGNFSVPYNDMEALFFHNLPKDLQEKILNYKLMVYICEGTDSEKLDWFKTINISGVPLNAQELRNAVYTGPWLTDAKRYFSKTYGAAHGLASDYLTGSADRQEYLETAIKWLSAFNNISIEEYMGLHQNDENAKELWQYFVKVIEWIELIFPSDYYRKEMKGIEWGLFYNQFIKEHENNTDTLEEQIIKKYGSSDKIEEKVKNYMVDDDIKCKAGIYEYILDGQEKHLNIRAFTASMKRSAYERQDGICPSCGDKFDIDDMDADHITPWSLGGKTEKENCQMLCKTCNRRKSNK